jgi:hypothetical protein
MDKLLMIFIGLSIVNVVFSTIKSIVTIKGSPFVASMVSALYYGYYNIVLIYTVADFPLWQKVVATFGCNLVGVYVVKYAEAKSRKDKLWRVESTIKPDKKDVFEMYCKEHDIPYNYVNIEKYILFNFYCATQGESAKVKKLLDAHDAKYFVNESKNL